MATSSLLLAAFTASAVFYGGAIRAASPSVGVFMMFDSAPGDSSVQVMEQEVNRLLLPSGVSLDWRLVAENLGKQAFSGLVVFKFRGKCRAERAPQPASDFGSLGESMALGSSRVVKGRVLPFGEVECDQVRRALSYLAPGANGDVRQKALGLAMARVVAHELYHMLAGTTAHALKGLAKDSQSLQDLVSPRSLEFQERDSNAIRDGVRSARSAKR